MTNKTTLRKLSPERFGGLDLPNSMAPLSKASSRFPISLP